MNIGCIGYGFVGSALVHTVSSKIYIKVFDIKKEPKRCGNITFVSDLKGLYDCDIIFICVPTPMNKDGSCDPSIVNSVLNSLKCNSTIVIKSTIIPGSIQNPNNLSLVYNPEFLTEKNSIDDFKNQKRIFLGGKEADKVSNFYEFLGYNKFIIYTVPDIKTFQIVKYLNNCFLASKVAIFNEYKEICDAENIDFELVRNAMAMDPRINESHTQVPGSDGKYGYGGSCFTKDTKAIIFKYNPFILKAIDNYNDKIRKL